MRGCLPLIVASLAASTVTFLLGGLLQGQSVRLAATVELVAWIATFVGVYRFVFIALRD
jgi:hypothetical protein